MHQKTMKKEHISFIKILEKLYTPIFKIEDERYYIREKTLKKNIERAILAIRENVYKPGIIVPNPWQKTAIDRNIKGLSDYLDNLVLELEKEKIIEYVKNFKFTHIDLRYERDEMILLVNSYHATIIYDIVWADNISVSDVINLSQGKVNNKNLEVKFHNMVNHLQESIIPFFSEFEIYKSKVSRLEEAVRAYNSKFYKSSSIMFISATEGLVKSLGQFLITKQNLDISKIKRPLHSLDSFLEYIPWESDYTIDIGKYMFLTGNYIFDRNYDVEDSIKIDLKTRLNFLKRQYKEDRNSILHGDDISFGEIWDLYVNFSALFEVHSTIKYYHELYN